MIDALALWYPWVKSLHVISVIAWMAGLFYLPRLFVYHAEQVGQSGETHDMFLVMERRLLKAIMNPAMISSWVFGLLLVMTPGIVDWGSVWPWTKALSVIIMTWFHMWLGARRKDFVSAENERSGRSYRIMNEVPTLLLLVIVFSVIVKF
jgi:putative membrane protein